MLRPNFHSVNPKIWSLQLQINPEKRQKTMIFKSITRQGGVADEECRGRQLWGTDVTSLWLTHRLHPAPTQPHQPEPWAWCLGPWCLGPLVPWAFGALGLVPWALVPWALVPWAWCLGPGCLGAWDVWGMFGGCLGDVWGMFGGCLGDVWVDVWGVFVWGCLGVFGGCLGGVLGGFLRQKKSKVRKSQINFFKMYRWSFLALNEIHTTKFRNVRNVSKSSYFFIDLSYERVPFDLTILCRARGFRPYTVDLVSKPVLYIYIYIYIYIYMYIYIYIYIYLYPFRFTYGGYLLGLIFWKKSNQPKKIKKNTKSELLKKKIFRKRWLNFFFFFFSLDDEASLFGGSKTLSANFFNASVNLIAILS